MNWGKECYDACGKGYCSEFCGLGNACCKYGSPSDPPECQGVKTFGDMRFHTCVKPRANFGQPSRVAPPAPPAALPASRYASRNLEQKSPFPSHELQQQRLIEGNVARPSRATATDGGLPSQAADPQGNAVRSSREVFGATLAKEKPSYPQTGAGKRPWLYLHIHKAAGSHMCELAMKAREQIVVPSQKCHWEEHDMPEHMGKPETSIRCEQRMQYMKDNGATYAHIAREFRLRYDYCPVYFTYATTIRHPMGRINAQMISDCGSGLGRERTKAAVMSDLRIRLGLDQGEIVTMGEETWKFYDNFQIRIIADAYNVPAGGISSEHVAKAKKVLESFDVVGIAEDLKDPQYIKALANAMGWTGLSNAYLRRDERTHTENRCSMTRVEEEWLGKLNEPEIQLYNWAVGKFGANA